MFEGLKIKLKQHEFLFEELVKRDFKKKYKRTILGMGWSILSPLVTMVIMNFVFGHIFGREIPHFAVYLLCGNLLFSYFKEATSGGMQALVGNASIFTKVNVPKYIFLLSKNVSSFINFMLTMLILLIFVAVDGISFHWGFIALLYPMVCLILFNLGIGMILSAYYVFFRDISYLYDLFSLLLMYVSAIFYKITIIPEQYRFVFYLNPVWIYINYFREIILEGRVPSLEYHALALFYALAAVAIGAWIYKRNNHKFLYYV